MLKITLRFIQPLKKVKLCKMANFPLTDTLMYSSVLLTF